MAEPSRIVRIGGGLVLNDTEPFDEPGDARLAAHAAMRTNVHHDGVSAVQARDAQLVDHRVNRLVPEVLVCATQVDQVWRVNGNGAHSAGAQLVAELGERLWLLLAAPPRGGVIRPDLDRCRANLLGPAGGLEQARREGQVRANSARFHGSIVWLWRDSRDAQQFDGHQTVGVLFEHGC